MQYYRWHFAPGDDGWAEVDDNAQVHAVLLDHPQSWRRYATRELRNMRGVVYLRRYESVTAVCGLSVRVVYPMSFETGEDEACRSCKSLLEMRRLVGEDEFWRHVDEAAHQQYMRELERDRKRQKRTASHQTLHTNDGEQPSNALQELMRRDDEISGNSGADEHWDMLFDGLLQRDTEHERRQQPPEVDSQGA